MGDIQVILWGIESKVICVVAVNIVINSIFAVFSIVLYFFINLKGLIDGPPPTFSNFFLTILFLGFWLLFGAFRGSERKASFLVFVTVFWGVGLGLSFVSMIIGPSPLVLVTIAFMAPVNGLNIFDFMRSKLFFGAMFLPVLMAYIGYFIGQRTIMKRTTRH